MMSSYFRLGSIFQLDKSWGMFLFSRDTSSFKYDITSMHHSSCWILSITKYISNLFDIPFPKSIFNKVLICLIVKTKAQILFHWNVNTTNSILLELFLLYGNIFRIKNIVQDHKYCVLFFSIDKWKNQGLLSTQPMFTNEIEMFSYQKKLMKP